MRLKITAIILALGTITNGFAASELNSQSWTSDFYNEFAANFNSGGLPKTENLWGLFSGRCVKKDDPNRLSGGLLTGYTTRTSNGEKLMKFHVFSHRNPYHFEDLGHNRAKLRGIRALLKKERAESGEMKKDKDQKSLSIQRSGNAVWRLRKTQENFVLEAHYRKGKNKGLPFGYCIFTLENQGL